jgi:ELWxxDGT repeat protein
MGPRLGHFSSRTSSPGELLRSDGTEAGTTLVKDIAPGPASSTSTAFAVDGILLFAADDLVHGVELWRTDGTESGTFLVQDIATGEKGSAPAGFRLLGDQVYFTADDGSHGREPWIGHASILTSQPQRAVEELSGEVKALELLPGIERSLLAKLDVASQALAVGNTSGAKGALQGFEMEVLALTPKWIDEDAAAELIEFASQITALFDGSLDSFRRVPWERPPPGHDQNLKVMPAVSSNWPK